MTITPNGSSAQFQVVADVYRAAVTEIFHIPIGAHGELASLINSACRAIPVRAIAEQHILEDLGRIPSFADWARCMRPEPWMGRTGRIATDDVGTGSPDQVAVPPEESHP